MARAELPHALQFLFEPARYKVAYGGRGGAKSWSIARALLVKAMSSKIRILCAREIQRSIRDSVHRLLKDQIDELGYGRYFESTQSTIRCASGSEFLFVGLHANVTQIKSMEGIDICWVEEGESVSDDSWRILTPTIRKDDSEIWVSFNPQHDTDPTYKRFVKDPPPNAIVRKVGWEDNPWLPDTLRAEKDHLYRVDASAAANVWGGECRKINKAQVLFGKVSVYDFTPEPTWDGPYQGADWGFADDPTVLVRTWIKSQPSTNGGPEMRDLFVEREAYGVGVDIVHIPSLFDEIPKARQYVTRADSARPETISHCKQNGYPLMVAAEKGPGSVEDGVEHLRSFRSIVIHPRCTHALDESRLWSYKQDRLTGDILPELIDKHNHCWDATRYALEPVMKRIKRLYEYQSVKKRATHDVSGSLGGGFRSRPGGVL